MTITTVRGFYLLYLITFTIAQYCIVYMHHNLFTQFSIDNI